MTIRDLNDLLSLDEEQVASELENLPEHILDEGELPPRVEIGINSEVQPEELSAATSDMRWYVVHTYSSQENRAKSNLEERIRKQNLGHKFGEILIPTESVVETLKDGQQRTRSRTFFPGYILVQMLLDDDSWHLVRTTPKITGFVGGGKRPSSVPDAEVRRLTKQIEEGVLRPKEDIQFSVEENVRITEGPFKGWNGVVDEVYPDKRRLRVMVSIFNRSTPVDVGFNEVNKS
jgi:transcriptional antiterminator NusG